MGTSVFYPTILAICALAGCTLATTTDTQAGTTGLSARYPDDQGIEKDPAVLFCDNFERDGTPQMGRD